MGCIIIYNASIKRDEMSDKTYIYDKKEYVATGRVAKRQAGRPGAKAKELVELRPATLPKDNNEYNVWVPAEELFTVET